MSEPYRILVTGSRLWDDKDFIWNVTETAESLRAALRSMTSVITSSSADFGAHRADAWIYGIAVGWDCEEHHEHDDICGGTAAMTELAVSFGWDEAAVARLRAYRTAYAAAVTDPVVAGNVIYCRGCRRIWVERSVSIVALASGVRPADCACECSDPADPLYEVWDVNPDEAELPEGVWVS